MGIPDPNKISEIVEAKKKAASLSSEKKAKRAHVEIALDGKGTAIVRRILKECFGKSLQRGYVVKLSEELSEPVEQALKCCGYRKTSASKLLSAVLKKHYPDAKPSKDTPSFNCDSLDDRMSIIQMMNSDPKLKSGEHKLILDSEISSIEYLVYELNGFNRSQHLLTWFNAPKTFEKNVNFLNGRTLEWIASPNGQEYLAEADFSLKGAARAGLETDALSFPKKKDSWSPSDGEIAKIFRELGFKIKAIEDGLEVALDKKRGI